MATATRPRRGTSKESLEELADRALQAERLAAIARRKASRIASDREQNRSTRARAALKVKAQALDDVAGILAGKG